MRPTLHRSLDAAISKPNSHSGDTYGGPAQLAPTIGQCLNGGYGWAAGQMPAVPDRGQPTTRARPPAARHPDLEARSGAEVPVMRDAAIFPAGARDQADGNAADIALRLGTSDEDK